MKPVWILILTFCVSGCGFHLRGMKPVPPALSQLRIITTLPSDAFQKTLRQTLLDSGVELSDNPANPSLEILAASNQSIPGSMSASAQTRQYNLSFTLQYQLRLANGDKIFAPRTIVTRRTLLQNTNRMLGSNTEEQTLFHEMQQEASRRVLDQLTAPKVARALEH